MDQLTATSVLQQGINELDMERFMGAALPPRGDLVAVLRHWAKERPDNPAFFFTDGENPEDDLCVTFAELDSAARSVAGYLQKSGTTTGERVLLIYPPVLDFVYGFFGCLYAGATAVPAFPPRRNRKGQRISRDSTRCQAHVALTTQQVRQQIEGDSSWTEWESISIVATDSMVSKEYAEAWTAPKIEPESLAVLQYTSGSTGDPKGVML